MRKRYTKRRSVRKACRKERKKRQAEKAREIQLRLNPEEVLAMLEDSMTDFATEMGLKVARLLLDDEVNQRCGFRYERVPERTVTRYGRQRGVVVIAGANGTAPETSHAGKLTGHTDRGETGRVQRRSHGFQRRLRAPLWREDHQRQGHRAIHDDPGRIAAHGL